MRPEISKLIMDIIAAADEVSGFTKGKSVDDFLGDAMLRRAVERCFEIIGEALTQLNKVDPSVAASFTDYRKIISFRNVLIHGYAMIDNAKTWDIVIRDLPVLRGELAALLKKPIP